MSEGSVCQDCVMITMTPTSTSAVLTLECLLALGVLTSLLGMRVTTTVASVIECKGHRMTVIPTSLQEPEALDRTKSLVLTKPPYLFRKRSYHRQFPLR